jgi:hypothetical protein
MLTEEYIRNITACVEKMNTDSRKESIQAMMFLKDATHQEFDRIKGTSSTKFERIKLILDENEVNFQKMKALSLKMAEQGVEAKSLYELQKTTMKNIYVKELEKRI